MSCCWPCTNLQSRNHHINVIQCNFWGFIAVYVIPNIVNFILEVYLSYAIPELKIKGEYDENSFEYSYAFSVWIIPIITAISSFILYISISGNLLQEVIRIDHRDPNIRDMRIASVTSFVCWITICILDVCRSLFWETWNITLILTQLIITLLFVGVHIIFLSLMYNFFYKQSQIMIEPRDDLDLEYNEARTEDDDRSLIDSKDQLEDE